jgi:hypothetical protein
MCRLLGVEPVWTETSASAPTARAPASAPAGDPAEDAARELLARHPHGAHALAALVGR